MKILHQAHSGQVRVSWSIHGLHIKGSGVPRCCLVPVDKSWACSPRQRGGSAQPQQRGWEPSSQRPASCLLRRCRGRSGGCSGSGRPAGCLAAASAWTPAAHRPAQAAENIHAFSQSGVAVERDGAGSILVTCARSFSTLTDDMCESAGQTLRSRACMVLLQP